eukprot:8995258-Pyramimonas_sp.AAC.1
MKGGNGQTCWAHTVRSMSLRWGAVQCACAGEGRGAHLELVVLTVGLPSLRKPGCFFPLVL